MKDDKLKWYIINKDYVNYLKKFDEKVQNVDYNSKLKPYIGILITINKFNYYVPISSIKEKHYKMKEELDFIKINDGENLMGVLNLNNMIPVNNENINVLKYKDIEKYREFSNQKERKLYISLLSFELNLINNKMQKIKRNANKLYNEKINNPNSKISKRCCNFKLLEEKAELYHNQNT